MLQLLIVDDERHLVDSMAEAYPWQELGIGTVHRAYAGQQGLELLDSATIDLVITDIRMPGISGLELIKHVRERHSRIKCILLSGHADFEYAQEAIRLQADEYILKPATKEDVFTAVSKVISKMKAEWAEISSYQRALVTMRENLPLVRSSLLNELLQGKQMRDEVLASKLESYDLPFVRGEQVSLLLVRMEEEFYEYDPGSISLMEYAISNMAAEIFADRFDLWHGKDSYDYLVFLGRGKSLNDHPSDMTELREQFESSAARLQQSVHTYLNGRVSVLVSNWGTFPEQVSLLHQSSLTTFRQAVGGESEFFITIKNPIEEMKIFSLKMLYEPPSLIHLLEANRWDAIEDKLEAVFHELNESWSQSQEHLLEVYLHIYNALMYIAHKNGDSIEKLIGQQANTLYDGHILRSIPHLRQWVYTSFEQVKLTGMSDTNHARSQVVTKAKSFIEKNMSQDVSLNTIADYVYLHPVYLSKIFKMETGESIGDYIYRIRMESAAHLLTATDTKIYEITKMLGYTNSNYFSKVFKRNFGLTPQEYRDQSYSSE